MRFANTHGASGIKYKKSELCAELGIGTLVEDDPRHAMDCASNGINVILFSYPWNKDLSADNVFRALSWDDVIRLVS